MVTGRIEGGRPMTTRSDVLQEVLKDHNEIKQLLADVELATGNQKRRVPIHVLRRSSKQNVDCARPISESSHAAAYYLL